MRMITSFAVLGLVVTMTACGDSSTGIDAEQFLSAQQLAAAGVTNLSGTWKLDPSLSMFGGGSSGPPTDGGGRGAWGHRSEAATGGRPSGAGTGRPGGRASGASFDGSLTIAQTATTVSINGMTIPTNGSTTSGGAGAPAGVSASAAWTAQGLTITRNAPHGVSFSETLTVSADGSTLTASISGGPMPSGMQRVFKRS